MASESTYDGRMANADRSELAGSRRPAWKAAAPYLVAAVLVWVAAGGAQYKLNEAYASGYTAPRPGEAAVLQVVSQALIYAGFGLFTLGFLVVVLRQHERWRRERGPSLADALAVADGVSITEVLDGPIDVTPSYERSLREQMPDQPDQQAH